MDNLLAVKHNQPQCRQEVIAALADAERGCLRAGGRGPLSNSRAQPRTHGPVLTAFWGRCWLEGWFGRFKPGLRLAREFGTEADTLSFVRLMMHAMA